MACDLSYLLSAADCSQGLPEAVRLGCLSSWVQPGHPVLPSSKAFQLKPTMILHVFFCFLESYSVEHGTQGLAFIC